MVITHDIHNHTTLSHCCYDPAASVENYVHRAAELGHKVFGLSNHLWDEKVPGASGWYKNQMIDYGLQERTCVPKDTCGVRVICGTETEYAAASDTLGMLADTAQRFDYILVPHSHNHMRNFVMSDSPDVKHLKELFAERIAAAMPELSADLVKKMANSLGYGDTDALVANDVFFTHSVDFIKYVADCLVDSFNALMANPEFIKCTKVVPVSVAHPFHPCGFSRDMRTKIVNSIPDEKIIDCMKSAKALGVNIEINTGAFTITENDYADEPAIRVMKLAKSVGCKFTFGTDTHSLAGLDGIRKGDDISRIVGITEDDLPSFVKA